MPCAIAQRLEGSRFAIWQLYRLAAGGSRERLEGAPVLWAAVFRGQNRRDWQNITLGCSREPPVAIVFGRMLR
jgi:hypothetical protein